jgi:hypothetical protein
LAEQRVEREDADEFVTRVTGEDETPPQDPLP